MKTSQKYIHEYADLDNLFSVMEKADRDVKMAYFDLTVAEKHATQKMFLEKEDDKSDVEKKSDNFFAKLGNAIMSVIKSIADFLKGIKDKITGNVSNFRSDEQIVREMMKDHPVIAYQIDYAIISGKYTYHDIAAYEKDVTSLIKMFERGALDEMTFKDKVKAAAQKFRSNLRECASTVKDVDTMLNAIPNAVKAVENNRRAVSDIQKRALDFKTTLDTSYGIEEKSKASAIWSALQEMIGLSTKEVTQQAANVDYLTNLTHKIAQTKVGKALNIDSTKADAKEVSKRNAAAERINNGAYDRKWIYGKN